MAGQVYGMAKGTVSGAENTGEVGEGAVGQWVAGAVGPATTYPVAPSLKVRKSRKLVLFLKQKDGRHVQFVREKRRDFVTRSAETVCSRGFSYSQIVSFLNQNVSLPSISGCDITTSLEVLAHLSF